MISRIRLYLCILLSIAVIAQIGPLQTARADDEAHLEQNVTSVSPANGESVAVDSVAGFSSQGGDAIFDPDNAFAEAFTYDGIDLEENTLLGLDRPTPRDHPAGSVVEAVDPETSPTPTASPSTAAAPSQTSTPTPSEPVHSESPSPSDFSPPAPASENPPTQ